MGILKDYIEKNRMEKDNTEKEKHIIRFTEAGDALRYAFFNELPRVIADEEKYDYAFHFYTVMAYLYLNGIVEATSVLAADIAIRFNIMNESVEKVIEKIAGILFPDFKEKLEFDDFDALAETLNQYIIPKWCFCIGYQICDSYVGDSVLCGDYLYYIAKSDGVSSLKKLNVNKINVNTVVRDEGMEVLDGFSDILAYDRKLHRIYLRYYNNEGSFCYFDIFNEDIVICEGSFFEWVDDVPFVVSGDGRLGMYIGESFYPLKEYYPYEKYNKRKDGFFITPSREYNRFFKPYYLNYDGRISKASDGECKEVLWNFIRRSFEMGVPFSPISVGSIGDSNKIPIPGKLSMNGIMKTLDANISDEEKCSDKTYIILKSVFELLSKYISDDQDITELLYKLYAVDCTWNKEKSSESIESIYDENLYRGFPSEKLYFMLKELDITKKSENNSLEKLLKEERYNDLFESLVGCKEETISTSDAEKQIGTFSISSSEVSVKTMSMDEGIYIGNQLLPDSVFGMDEGIVTYDTFLKCFCVTSCEPLTQIHKLQIVKDFKLGHSDIIYVVQKRKK